MKSLLACEKISYSKTCLKRPLNTKNGFQYQLSLNAGQKYSRMLQGEHSAILSTCIKLPNDFKTFVLSFFFEWPLKTGFTVYLLCCRNDVIGLKFSNIFVYTLSPFSSSTITATGINIGYNDVI